MNKSFIKVFIVFFIGLTFIINACNKDEGDIPTVVTGSVSEVAFHSAYCEGNVTDEGGSPVISKGVCLSTGSEPTISDKHSDHGDGTGSFKSGFTDLSTNTTYYVRAYATSSEGTAYGSQVSFKTLAK